jgi:hypothetical protein
METRVGSKASNFRVLRNCPEEIEVSGQVTDQLVAGGKPMVLREVFCLSGVPTVKMGRNGILNCTGEQCEKIRRPV